LINGSGRHLLSVVNGMLDASRLQPATWLAREIPAGSAIEIASI
jgi:hypothetical protein